MNEQDPKEIYVKETLIGVAAACFSIVVIVALMEGGGRTAFMDALTLLVVAFAAPLIYIPSAPWLVIVITLAATGVWYQYRRVPPKYMRYLVGCEIIVWQLLGFQLITAFFMQ